MRGVSSRREIVMRPWRIGLRRDGHKPENAEWKTGVKMKKVHFRAGDELLEDINKMNEVFQESENRTTGNKVSTSETIVRLLIDSISRHKKSGMIKG
jgi:hypothetical protein